MFRPASFRAKLFLAMFGPSVLVLVLLGLAGIWMDVYSLRANLEHEARSDSALLALAIKGPLSIGDDIAVSELLASLKGAPDVVAAAVYSSDDQLVAHYPENQTVPTVVPKEGRKGEVLMVVEEVRSGNEVIGRLLMQISLSRYYLRLWWFVFGAVGAVMFLSLLAALGARMLMKQFTVPLQELSSTAQDISQRKDYGVRAPAFKETEFQNVTNAFNHMLQEIEKRNSAIEKRSSELEQTNRELATANKELEAFTYSVSHDLRSPLRAIAGYAQVLADEYRGTLPAEGLDYVRRVESNAIRMGTIIDDLLAFSRVDAQPLKKEMLSPTALAREVLEDVRGTQPSGDLDVQIDEMPAFMADGSLMRQVYTNLISNALKYSRNRPRQSIHIGAFEDGKETVYFVKDNGVGFDMQYYSKLFGIFQRLHGEKDYEGTGVGLAIVQRIIKRHGGKIWAESKPEEGAEFFFKLQQS